MDALDLLREDHQHLLAMLERLELAPTVADDTDGKVLDARKALVIDIVIAESQHEAVEEEYFWPMVRDGVPDGDRLADHAIDQERAAKYLLAALEGTPADHKDIDAMIARLVYEGRAHIDYEQNEVWPRVRGAVGADRLGTLAGLMADAKKNAPTRPHPDTLPTPAAQKTVGKVAALADRIRDSLSGRTR